MIELFYKNKTGKFYKKNQNKPFSKENFIFGTYSDVKKYHRKINFEKEIKRIKIFNELKSLETMECLMQEGIDIMEKCKTDNEDFLRLLNLAKFIKNSVTTGKNAKQFYILKEKLNLAETKESAGKLIEKIENLLLSEKENVISTVPLVKNDSSLGWEPSMEYFTNEKCLNWKLRQLDYELNHTIPTLKQSNNY